MRRLALLPLVGIIVLVGVGSGGPVKPREPEIVAIPSLFVESLTDTFATQKRAQVVVAAARNYVGVYVFDIHGNCVGWDDFGSPDAHESLMAKWYPPEIGVYGIDVHNFGRQPRKVEVALP